jgi:hypothetical protein
MQVVRMKAERRTALGRNRNEALRALGCATRAEAVHAASQRGWLQE